VDGVRVMDHDFDLVMAWCRRCGRPLEEIVEADMNACDGLMGAVHQRFLKAQAAARAVFDPSIAKLIPKP